MGSSAWHRQFPPLIQTTGILSAVNGETPNEATDFNMLMTVALTSVIFRGALVQLYYVYYESVARCQIYEKVSSGKVEKSEVE